MINPYAYISEKGRFSHSGNKMRKVKTHTFNGKKFNISHYTEISGLCDYAAKELSIMRGNDIKALGSALEEGLHALGVPDRYLHKPENKVKIGKSLSKVDDLARFLWRLGYRKDGGSDT